MPLHRNESSSGKTMNFVDQDQGTFVKESYMLSREGATVMTTVNSSNKLSAPPCEYFFKKKGTRVKLSPPPETNFLRRALIVYKIFCSMWKIYQHSQLLYYHRKELFLHLMITLFILTHQLMRLISRKDVP